MTQFGKTFVFVGLAIVLIGAIVWGLGKLGFRGLPGDIRYESDNVKIYFPIVTCLAISLVLSVLVWLVRMVVK
ncbi:MAG: DUF2905 domain-containing protein [Planctomycetota bacterium]|jgi:hypothetical protein